MLYYYSYMCCLNIYLFCVFCLSILSVKDKNQKQQNKTRKQTYIPK
jgi:hypothetical protein